MTTLIPKFEQPFTGAANRPINLKLQESVSVLDFGAINDGVADCTSSIQTAINDCALTGKRLFFPAGQYLVTSTISIPQYTNIYGEYNYQGFNDSTNNTSSIIQFKPATAQSLFVASGSTTASGNFRPYYSIDSLFINGNSSTSTGNSIYAIDANLVIYSTFRNLKIWGFRNGIKCTQTIGNRFENIQIGYSTISCVLYQGSTCTTDVWEQCTFNLSVLGVSTVGASSTIRFNNCIFEDLDNGVDLAKECYGWSFTNCYAENIPRTNTAGAMFSVGYSGTTFAVAPALSIIGGTYLGNDTYTSSVGTWLTNNGAYSIYIANPFVTNIQTVIYNTLSAKANSLIFAGLSVQSYTTLIYQPASTIQGFLTDESLNAGSGNEQNMYAQYVTAQQFLGPASVFFGSSSSSVYIGAPGSAVKPYTGNNADLGSSGDRWNNIFLANAPNVSSDASLKTIIGSLDDAEKAVAKSIKGLFKTYKLNSSIAEKGEDKARIHVGVVAQEVRDAFIAEGLDPTRYSLFCSDTWYEVDGKTHDDKGNVYTAEIPNAVVVTKLGIRYEELLAFVISAL
jgi:hypothetical protein